MNNDNPSLDKITAKLDELIILMKHSIAIQLYLSKVTQDDIAKNLNLSKTTVNQMVKGIKKES